MTKSSQACLYQFPFPFSDQLQPGHCPIRTMWQLISPSGFSQEPKESTSTRHSQLFSLHRTVAKLSLALFSMCIAPQVQATHSFFFLVVFALPQLTVMDFYHLSSEERIYMPFNWHKLDCLINGSPSKVHSKLANKDDLVY